MVVGRYSSRRRYKCRLVFRWRGYRFRWLTGISGIQAPRRRHGGAFSASAVLLVTIGASAASPDHMTEYYVYIPLIGFAGWAGWRLPKCGRELIDSAESSPTAVALLYAFLVVPASVAGAEWNYGITMRARGLVEEWQRPTNCIRTKRFSGWRRHGPILERFPRHPFKVAGHRELYLAPAGTTHPRPIRKRGRRYEFVLPPHVATKSLEHGEMVGLRCARCATPEYYVGIQSFLRARGKRRSAWMWAAADRLTCWGRMVFE